MKAKVVVAGLTLAVLVGGVLQVPAQGKKLVEGTGSGTIRGRVTYDGTPPAAGKLKIDAANKDVGHCNKGDTADPTWVVDATKGVANAVVFLRPPANSAFKVDLSKKTWPDEVVVDQPYCAFKPFVSVVFPEYNGQRTGQKFVVKNSAPILHNSRVAGSSFRNPAKNVTLTGGNQQAYELKADTQVLKINCDAHKWMEAFVWSFDHPFAAVTKPDGTFEIKNVPTGVEVSVMVWHPAGTPANGKEIQKGTLNDGDSINVAIKK